MHLPQPAAGGIAEIRWRHDQWSLHGYEAVVDIWDAMNAAIGAACRSS
jgi:hypothetical protein